VFFMGIRFHILTSFRVREKAGDLFSPFVTTTVGVASIGKL